MATKLLRLAARATSICLAALAVHALSACCGKSGPACLGEVDDRGKVYKPETATTAGKEAAQRFACNQFCRDADPTCDAMIRIWQGSAAGKGKPRGEALYADARIMECVTKTCADRCVADVAAGRRKGRVVCQ